MDKILVVDDSESVRVALKSVLEAAGYHVEEAFDGLDALQKVQSTPDFAMILLDINMPEMNGLEFAKEQSQIESICRIPTILVTTESHPKLALEAKKTGVVKAWLTKPVKPEILVSTIKRILKKLKGTY